MVAKLKNFIRGMGWAALQGAGAGLIIFMFGVYVGLLVFGIYEIYLNPTGNILVLVLIGLILLGALFEVARYIYRLLQGKSE